MKESNRHEDDNENADESAGERDGEGDVGSDEYEEEATYDHVCTQCGHVIAQHYYAFRVCRQVDECAKRTGRVTQEYYMECTLCGKGMDESIVCREEGLTAQPVAVAVAVAPFPTPIPTAASASASQSASSVNVNDSISSPPSFSLSVIRESCGAASAATAAASSQPIDVGKRAEEEAEWAD